MLKHLIFVAVLSGLSSTGFASGLPVLEPSITPIRNLNPEMVRQKELHAKLVEKISEGFPREKLTAGETALLNRFGWENYWDIWATQGNECSWYCGGGPEKVLASSYKSNSSSLTYVAANAHDFSLKMAWVEGVPGYGVGEYLEYLFKHKSPRITMVLIYNGYVRTETLWRENSRVKRLLLSVNGEPYAQMVLKDTRDLQSFALPAPLGRRPDGKDLSLRFRIEDVYEGTKSKDTAITELYFDGIDVH
jgi:hypothetical protein